MDSLPRLAPRSAGGESQARPTTMMPLDLPDGNPPMPPPTSSNRLGRRNARITNEQWERIKKPFVALYKDQGRSLKDAMDILKAEHSFIATRNQFNYMINKWKLDKKVKRSEMKHIVKIRNRRLQEDPNKRTMFRLRHMPVEEPKILRFERDHASASVPSSGTPTDIGWSSPAPEAHTSLEDASINQLLEWSPSSPLRKTSRSSRPPDGPNDRPRLDWSPTSSESAILRQLDSFLQYPSSRQSQVAASSPSLQHFDWLRSFETHHERQDTSWEIYPSLSSVLQDVVISGDTYEEQMINQRRSLEFETLKAEAESQGLVPSEGPGGCPLCTVFGLMCSLLDLTQGLSEFYQLDWSLCASEIAKSIFKVCVDRIERGGAEMGEVVKLIFALARCCLTWGLLREANAVVRAAIVVQDLAPPKTIREKQHYLDLVGHAIFAQEFETAEALLRKTIGQDSGIFADRDTPEGEDEEEIELRFMLHLLNTAAYQLNIIRWFRSRPETAKRAFSQRHSSQCGGWCNVLMIRSEAFCIHYRFCEKHVKVMYELMWTKVRAFGDIVEGSSDDPIVLDEDDMDENAMDENDIE